MSIKAYKHVWQLNITGADKLVMLAIADHADNNGDCWIGYERLAKLTGISDRHVKRVVKSLHKNGIILCNVNGGRGNSNAYHIPLNSDTVSPFNEEKKGDISPKTVTSDAKTVTSDALNSDTVSPEPYEPIEPTNVVGEKTPSQKNGASKPKPKTELSNVFIDETGIAMPKRKTDVKFWWSSIGELYEICGKDIEVGKKLVAYTVKKMRDDELTISNPNSILNTARAVMAQRAAQKFKTTQPTTAKVTQNGGAYL